MYSGEFPKVKSGTLEEMFQEELVKVENGEWKCPHILHVHSSNEGFIIIPLISFSSLLASSFLKGSMVLSEHKRRKQKRRKQQKRNQKKIHVGFKVYF